MGGTWICRSIAAPYLKGATQGITATPPGSLMLYPFALSIFPIVNVFQPTELCMEHLPRQGTTHQRLRKGLVCEDGMVSSSVGWSPCCCCVVVVRPCEYKPWKRIPRVTQVTQVSGCSMLLYGFRESTRHPTPLQKKHHGTSNRLYIQGTKTLRTGLLASLLGARTLLCGWKAHGHGAATSWGLKGWRCIRAGLWVLGIQSSCWNTELSWCRTQWVEASSTYQHLVRLVLLARF